LKSFEYELSGQDSDAINIGKSVGEKLLNLQDRNLKKNEYFNYKTFN
jgi:hypothetical protein